MNFIKEKLLKTLTYVTVSFVILVLLTTIIFYYNQDTAKELIRSFLEANSDMINASGEILMTNLIINNITAAMMSIIMGIVPFLFVPIFSLVINSVMIGATLGFTTIASSTSVFKILLLGIMPHGIFELPALFISMSMGVYLCNKISRKILGKEKESLIEVIKNIVKTFIIIVIPLLILAGIVEAYITPILISNFL
ncbi:MAG: stage II sporulation protein M [Peptostreptococcaceae bacterium]